MFVNRGVPCSNHSTMTKGSFQCWTSIHGNLWFSITNNNTGFKEHTRGYRNCNINQIFIFGGYIKARESLHTLVDI